MKSLKSFMECNASPANTVGAGNPVPANADGTVGTEPMNGKDVTEKPKKKKKKEILREEELTEAMRFPKKNFLFELSVLLTKYSVSIDSEHSSFKDKYNKTIIEFNNEVMNGLDIQKVACKTSISD